MIDMSALYEHSKYQNTLENFQLEVENGECEYTAWGLFKTIHLDITNNKCPICQCSFVNPPQRLTNNGQTTITATIDHYRPQEFYSFLRCDDKNYLLLCSECNNLYKGNLFPLFPLNSTRWTEESFIEEKPLIVNPILDNVLEFFNLVFRYSSSGKKVLELTPKVSLEEDEYKFKKALETIKTFGLGDCEENRHSNPNVHNCRIQLLETHFDRFHNFAKIMKSSKKEEFKERIKNSSGFLQFIAKEQFINLIN